MLLGSKPMFFCLSHICKHLSDIFINYVKYYINIFI